MYVICVDSYANVFAHVEYQLGCNIICTALESIAVETGIRV